MPIPIRTPRINNNDDLVRFTRIHRSPGTFVHKGDAVAEIETDKASFTVEVDEDAYVLEFPQPLGEMISVGSVLVWLGSSPEESVPADAAYAGAPMGSDRLAAEPTLKAAVLLRRFGLTPSDVHAAGERLTAEDVLAHVQRRNLSATSGPPAPHVGELPDVPPGDRVSLSLAERAMLKTVLWHRDEAVAGYVEVEYETSAWDRYAAAFQDRHQLLMNPLLSVMAYRLVRLARENPKLNCTMVGNERHQYSAINLGFTIQSGSKLTLLSVRDAERLTEREFVDGIGAMMRLAMKDKLSVEQTSAVTVSFSSMSRWEVTRHVPVLPPYTSLIVAHARGRDGVAALGASYDHRVLTGGEVAVALRALAVPDEEGEPTT